MERGKGISWAFSKGLGIGGGWKRRCPGRSGAVGGLVRVLPHATTARESSDTERRNHYSNARVAVPAASRNTNNLGKYPGEKKKNSHFFFFTLRKYYVWL